MNNQLIIKKTEDSPAVIMDAEKGYVCISGISWPEDALSFYNPLHDWIREYFNNPQKITNIEFKFAYFNTASAKQIAKFITTIKESMKDNKIAVKWFYEKEDSEMLKTGKRYANILNIDFEFIETERQDEDDNNSAEGVYKIQK
ncbi:MAG: DUF1987 domain-containing protein [Bacteroidales bacterium]|jgi:hypothetical protein|nr:DUF1987 domain-containing protein [Bacteroidales bacterium]